ncbi:MAG: DUF2240 family protein [Thermoplasmatota archaeon]
MSDDLKKMLAAVFKMGKGESLTKVEMTNLMIYNLRWFDPEGAKTVIKAGIHAGYLKKHGDNDIIPTFDPDEVETETGWEPPKDLNLKTMVRPLIERLIETVLEAGLEKKEAIRLINRVSEENGLLFAASAVHVGLDHGADMSGYYDEVENFILYGDR